MTPVRQVRLTLHCHYLVLQSGLGEDVSYHLKKKSNSLSCRSCSTAIVTSFYSLTCFSSSHEEDLELTQSLMELYLLINSHSLGSLGSELLLMQRML